ncbi:MAG: acyltransferase [Anaerolineales bacterium]|nr:acyltransferase [Anaerolineales bacterium]
MYRGLNSFRAFAFLAVFAYHCKLFTPGYLGVQAFFVLSGFLLTPILIDTKKTLPPRSFFVNFFGRRALRIFPLSYLYLLLILLICLLIINTKNYSGVREINLFIKQIPWALTYAYDFFHASRLYEHNYFLTHFWSLAVEEQFYLLWPFLIFFVNQKHFKALSLIIIFLGPVLRLLITIVSQSGGFPFLGQPIDLVIYVLPFSHIDAFAMGGYFALYQTSDKTNIQTLVLLYCSTLLGYVSQYIPTGQIDILSFGYREFLRDQYIWGYSLANFIFAKIIVQIKDGKFFPLVINNSFLEYLGKISYGLYVFHYPVIWLIGEYNPSMPRIGIALISFLITLVISSISYEIFEKRFLGMKDKFFSKSK